MNDLFLVIVGLLVVGMMVMMIKYAKFIHNQPKMEAEKRENTNKDNPSSDDTSK